MRPRAHREVCHVVKTWRFDNRADSKQRALGWGDRPETGLPKPHSISFPKNFKSGAGACAGLAFRRFPLWKAPRGAEIESTGILKRKAACRGRSVGHVKHSDHKPNWEDPDPPRGLAVPSHLVTPIAWKRR